MDKNIFLIIPAGNSVTPAGKPEREKTMNLFDKIIIIVDRAINQWEPMVCYACKRIVPKKDTERERSTLGVWVTLCKTCHKDIFSPFGEK